MHYIPESAREFLPAETPGSARPYVGDVRFHYQAAPVYLLTMVVGALLLADLLIGTIDDPAWNAYRSLLGFRLSLLAAVLGGSRILYRTLEGLFEGRIGADLALTIAALAAIVVGEHTTAALVVFIALCGESIEGYLLDRAQSAIRKLFDLSPRFAHVVRDNRELDVPIDDVRIGETVTIRPGERIPVDGIVTAGLSAVDESALTGESLPVDKAIDALVFTGTLNQHGSLSVATRKLSSETTLAKVIQLVAEATRHKTPLERTSDRLARVFLPFVLGAALLTLIAWRFVAGNWAAGINPALGVLVVACPCPLILATPTAIIAAMAWLAHTGVVVKGSVALERLAAVDTIAFDKTGTLTRGELSIDRIVAIPPLDETELLRVAAIAERRSEHLLARLIVREAESRNAVIPGTESFITQPGAGVVALVRSTILGSWAVGPRVDSLTPRLAAAEPGEEQASNSSMRTVVVGNRALLASRNIAIPPEIDRELAQMEQSGLTTLLVAVDDHVLGAISVRDTVRTESRAILTELKEAGIESFALLTGDRPEAAAAVASSLGHFDEVHAALFPGEKARWIEERIQAGRKVAMVGDGINDAPALAVATVGLALGGVGSDMAAEAGDLVLLGDPLRPLPALLRLSRALVRNIRESILIFAFGANAIGILLCALGVLNPVGGAVFHEFSSLAVMLNATRLLWFERWGRTSLGRASQNLAEGAERLVEVLSPTKLVFQLIENRAIVAGVVLPTAVLLWLMCGIVCIRENERAVVTRFGRAEADLGPGVYWRFPVPLERVIREPVGLLRAVQMGFRVRDGHPINASDRSRIPIEWTSEHNESGFESRPQESLLLTGDEVLVEMTAEIHWRIANLRTFLFESSKPAETLRTVAESVLREMAAHQPLDGILTERRLKIEDDCLAKLRNRLKFHRLGIEAVDLTLLDVHPPRSVVAAYRDVADALEEREERIDEAEAYYAGKLLGVAGEQALRVLEKSTGSLPKRDQSTTGRVSDWTLPREVWSDLTRESPSRGFALSGEGAAVILAARQAANDVTQAATGSAARFNELLDAYRRQPQLTRSQLYWKAVVESLSDRAVTIIDPKAGGRKRFVLGGPDDLRSGSILQDSPSAAPADPRPESAPSPSSSGPVEGVH